MEAGHSLEASNMWLGFHGNWGMDSGEELHDATRPRGGALLHHDARRDCRKRGGKMYMQMRLQKEAGEKNYMSTLFTQRGSRMLS